MPVPLPAAAVPAPAPKKWVLDDEPIPDSDRAIPLSLHSSVHSAFLRLPEAALPRGPLKGKYNFTVIGTSGAKVEIQLASKGFRLMKFSGGLPYSGDTSPQISWAAIGSVQGAWDSVLKRLAGPLDVPV
jgi:hypothetical protein